ncbi:MAG TPA: hypothetical protein VGN98_11500 [Tianweitania sediminis]|jgi:8-oxo-dGTP pyrophosphatase MutT (NUDIX family)|nr:hypothetical protein [Tianweitania sediminis]
MTRRDLLLNQMQPVRAVNLRLDPDPLPFSKQNPEAIARHWHIEKAAQPALFNGGVLMFSQMEVADDELRGCCHLTDYASLLYWRSIRPHPGVIHCFAHPALVAKDGALVAIRMSQRTANPGKVYFAAGSLEEADLRDGVIDIAFNMEREVAEETGLNLRAFPHEPGYQVLATTAGTVVFRRYQLPMSAEAIADRIQAHVAADPDPEIDGAVILGNSTAAPDGLLPHMQMFRDWHFDNPMAV